MNVQIFNYGAFIRLFIDSSVLNIAKAHVKIVETIKDDTIRINIGEGPLKEILIRLFDVTQPAGLPDINSLRDYICHLKDTSNKFEDDALVLLQNQINELLSLRQQLNVVNGSIQIDLGYQQAQLNALVAIDALLTRQKDLYEKFLDNQEKQTTELRSHTASLLSIDKELTIIKGVVDLILPKLDDHSLELKKHTQILSDNSSVTVDIKSILEHTIINQKLQTDELVIQSMALGNILTVSGKTESYLKTMLTNQEGQSLQLSAINNLLSEIKTVLQNKP